MMEFQEFWRKYQFSFWVMVHSWLQLSTIQTDQSTQEKSVISRTREVCRHHWYLMKRARLETLIPCWPICAYNLRVSSGRIQSSLISQELYHLKSILILWITYIFFSWFQCTKLISPVLCPQYHRLMQSFWELWLCASVYAFSYSSIRRMTISIVLPDVPVLYDWWWHFLNNSF